MERPKLEDSKKIWLTQPITTRESAYSLYSKEQDKFIDFQESEINRLKEQNAKGNSFLEWSFSQLDADTIEDYDTYDKLNEYLLSQNKQ